MHMTMKMTASVVPNDDTRDDQGLRRRVSSLYKYLYIYVLYFHCTNKFIHVDYAYDDEDDCSTQRRHQG